MKLPTKMQAAVLESLKNDLKIDEIELPSKLEFGQVLVQVKYSGICGSQIGEINGVKGEDKFLPHLLGHEGSGKVLSIGPNVTRFEKGDHVVMHWRPSLGIQSSTPNYNRNGKKINAGLVTTFNEYSIVSENRLTKIPKKYPLELASLYGCAVTTGFGVIENNAEVKIGQSVIVVGAGGVGLNITQAAKLRNAFPIISVDLFQNRLELSKKFGATHTILNDGKSNWQDEAKEILNNKKADFVIDNTGNSKVIELCYELTNETGRTILVGVPNVSEKASIYTLPLHFGKKIIGSHGGDARPHLDIPRYMNLEKQGFFSTNELITEVFDLKDINKAITKIKNGSLTGRCLIKCS